MKVVATNISRPEGEMPRPCEAVRAEALFVSPLQPSASVFPDQVRRAVATTLRRLGARGCAVQMAGEFGDHPDIAAARMSWALATIHSVYAAPSMPATCNLRPLAFAS